MRRHYNQADRPGTKLHKVRLSELPSFDAGTTYADRGGDTRDALMNRRGRTKAQCWCQKRLVDVTLAEVYAGVTHTCGRPQCKEPL